MPVMRDAQDRPFSMMACPECAAAGPHLPIGPVEDATFACFKCTAAFRDITAATHEDLDHCHQRKPPLG